MTRDREHLPAAPEHPARPSAAAHLGSDGAPHRSAGDAADLALTFRATGPAYSDPRNAGSPSHQASRPVARQAPDQAAEQAPRQAEERYEFHARSWFEGPGNGVHGLVQAARSGSWDPLVDPLPALDASPSRPSHSGSCAAEDAPQTPPQASVRTPQALEKIVVEVEPVLAATTSRRRATGDGWARAALTATEPVDLDSWFRPSDSTAAPTQPVDLHELFGAQDDEPYSDHPSGPLPQAGTWPPQGTVPDSPALLAPQICDAFDATLNGPLGFVELGFRGGFWYSVTDTTTRPVTVAEAIRVHPQLASQITQLVCWWMRQHPMSDRALDLATELSLGVAQLTGDH